MCGIFCSISSHAYTSPSDELQRRLYQRGPDSQHTICRSYGGSYITLCSTVLSLRGSQVVTQPLQDELGEFVLCWNGEAWTIDGKPQSGNDTQVVLGLLRDSVQGLSNPTQSVAAALSRIAGPYAFVFFDALRGRLFYGRDFLGRRSLMTRITDDGELLIASVSDGTHAGQWTEVDAAGVYCVNLQDFERSTKQPASNPELPQPELCPYHYADHGTYESRPVQSVG